MELTGDEKRIQALFSELMLEDDSLAPRFDQLWIRAQATKPERVVILNRSFVAVASILIVVAACSLMWWRNVPTKTRSGQEVGLLPPLVSEPDQLPQEKPKKLMLARADTLARKVQPKRVRSRGNERAVIQEAVVLSTWSSPTRFLMDSPANPVLQSLPQLTQSSRELESFLPNTEVKEWNQ